MKPKRKYQRRISAAPPAAPVLEIHYRKDREHIRIWRSDWSSDTFDTVDATTFARIEEVCRLLSIPLIDKTDED